MELACLARERLSPSVFGKVPPREKFVEDKRECMADLPQVLRLPQSHKNALYHKLRPCILQLNKLPFLYTYDSGGPRFSSTEQPTELRSLPPPKAKTLMYRAPFISIHLDGSKRSLQFWQRLAEFVQRSEYPTANLFPPEPNIHVEIAPSGFLEGGVEKITRADVQKRAKEAGRFFKDLEKLVGEFL